VPVDELMDTVLTRSVPGKWSGQALANACISPSLAAQAKFAHTPAIPLKSNRINAVSHSDLQIPPALAAQLKQQKTLAINWLRFAKTPSPAESRPQPTRRPHHNRARRLLK
jgi:hypothetical protein